MSVQPNPRPQSIRFSTKANASSKETVRTRGRANQRARSFCRFGILPQASSPRTAGCIKTRACCRRATSWASARRRWSIQTEVSTSTCIACLFGAAPTPACFRLWGRAAEGGQAQGGLALNQRLQAQMNQTRLLTDAGKIARFRHEVVIQVNSRSHAYKYAQMRCTGQNRRCFKVRGEFATNTQRARRFSIGMPRAKLSWKLSEPDQVNSALLPGLALGLSEIFRPG